MLICMADCVLFVCVLCVIVLVVSEREREREIEIEWVEASLSQHICAVRGSPGCHVLITCSISADVNKGLQDGRVNSPSAGAVKEKMIYLLGYF